ncbi:hypothetical protein D3C72_1105270 [compost metagenome]
MEMQASFLGDRQRLKEAVEQPALATPDGAEQIQAWRGSSTGGQQQTGLLRHALDDALLAVAEGVALTAGLVSEVIADRLGTGVMPGAGRQTLAEPAVQRRPALDQSRSFRRVGRHCRRLRVRQNRLPGARRCSVTRRRDDQPPRRVDNGRLLNKFVRHVQPFLATWLAPLPIFRNISRPIHGSNRLAESSTVANLNHRNDVASDH